MALTHLALAMVVGAALPLSAQQTADSAVLVPSDAVIVPSPILTIQQDKLYTGTLYGRAVQARTEVATRTLQAENRQIEADLEMEEKDLTQRRASLPPAEFRALAEAFDTKVEGIRAAQEAKARALAKESEARRQRFFETAVPILADLMGEIGAVAIVDKSAIILSFDRIDITDRAIARIDEVLKDGAELPVEPMPAP